MTSLMILAGLTVTGWVAALVASAQAPMGYQDEAGFHYGAPTRRAVEDSGTASCRSAA